MEALCGRALLQWPLAFASAALFGTAAFALMTARVDGNGLESTVSAMSPIWRAMALVVALLSPLLLLDLTGEMAMVSWPQAVPLVSEVLGQTHFGEVWRWALPIAFLLLIGAFAPMASFFKAWLLLGASGVLMLLEAMLSHAVDKGSIAVVVYLIHETAAGTWIGALMGLWIAARRGKPSAWIARAAQMVSTTAAWSVMAIVVSGLYTAYLGLGFSIDRLLFTGYGRTLVIKVVVFCAVLSIGAYNRERLVPDIARPGSQRVLLRNVGIESLVLSVLVLGLASLLANTPPAKGHMMSHPGVAMKMAWPFTASAE
jgi:putative copper resistance protein D